MSIRDTILDNYKTCLGNIIVANGFTNAVKDVQRKFLYYDQVFNFPALMVLGGDEKFEDQLGEYSISRLTVRIVGYTKNVSDPDGASCSFIADVMKCLENATYNINKAKMRIIGVETDEGMLHAAGEGLSMFIITLETIYRFKRDTP